MTLRDLLLRAYPRSWREEYGEELAAILAQSRPTARLIADTLFNGARQHFQRDASWKYCGVALALWFLAARPIGALCTLAHTRFHSSWYCLTASYWSLWLER